MQTAVVSPDPSVSVQDFEHFLDLPENRERLFELIEGRIVEKMPTELHGAIALIIAGELYIYLQKHPIARAMIEVRHRVPSDEANALQPDLAVSLDTSQAPIERGAVMKMPDLAIEIKSPSNGYDELRAKARYYLLNGAKLVWLVYPEKKLVEVHRANADSDILTLDETLTGGDVLPEFSLPVKTLFKVR